jgi:hypothetical protein
MDCSKLCITPWVLTAKIPDDATHFWQVILATSFGFLSG